MIFIKNKPKITMIAIPDTFLVNCKRIGLSRTVDASGWAFIELIYDFTRILLEFYLNLLEFYSKSSDFH